MAIIATRRLPAEGPATVFSAIRDLTPDDRLGGAGAVAISEPLAVYRLGLDQITGSDSLRAAQFVGWRYLLETGDRSVGMADVAGRGGATRLTSLARNEQAALLLKAAHVAEKTAADLHQDCEARILTVPALHLSTLWLSTEPPIFIPFIDAMKPVRSLEDVEARPAFLSELVARARAARDVETGRKPPTRAL